MTHDEHIAELFRGTRRDYLRHAGNNNNKKHTHVRFCERALNKIYENVKFGILNAFSCACVSVFFITFFNLSFLLFRVLQLMFLFVRVCVLVRVRVV